MRSGCASSAPHPFPNLPPDLIGAIDPHALKIPAPKGRNTRYPETATLHFRLNQDSPGKAYYAEVEDQFDDYALQGDYKAATFEKLRQQLSSEILRLSNSEPVVQIDASPFLSPQIAEVNGKLHVFMTNFR